MTRHVGVSSRILERPDDVLSGRGILPAFRIGRGSLTTYKIGYFVGSLSSASINRELSKALIRLAPEDLEFTESPIGNLPLYSPDYDEDFPLEPRAMKEAIAGSDAILIITPEYNRSIPGALKNALDWASRPAGQNSFAQMPAAVIGASAGQLGTAMAQQSLRGVLSFCNARQMTAPEAYIRYSPGTFPGEGEVADESTKTFLTNYMNHFRTYVIRVLTVIPERSPASFSQLVSDPSGVIPEHSYGVRPVNRAGVSWPRCLRGWVRRGERIGCRRRLCRDSYARVGAA